jgi:hypothetical protein
MFLLFLVLAGRLTMGPITDPMPAVVSLGRLDSSGLVEVCNGTPVSESHVVTLFGFASSSSPFAITPEGRLIPDSTIFFRDLGLAMMVFEGTPFRRWNDPQLEPPLAGETIFVAGYRSDGITLIQAHAMEFRNDGTVVLSVPPAPGLMGAAAYNGSGKLVGIITGTLSDSSGNTRLALLPSQLWGVWSGNLVAGVNPSGTPFGVSAIAYAMGDIDDETPSGVLIIDVCQNSRAQACGLVRGDLVLTAGGIRIYHPETLRGIIQTEENIEISVYRDGTTLSLLVR